MFDRISLDPDICNGKPCIRGMRFPVSQIIDLVAAGNSFDQILRDFPDLEEADVRQALGYAAYLTREEWVSL